MDLSEDDVSHWIVLMLGCREVPTDAPLPIRERTMDVVPSESFVGPVTVSWEQPEPADVHVEYQLDGEWRATPTRSVEAGEVATTVVGLPPSTTAEWRVVVETALGRRVQPGRGEIESNPLPESFPELTIEIPDALGRDDYVFTSVNERSCGWCSGPYWSFITDREGRVVWATRTVGGEWTLFTQLAVTGDHLIYVIIRTSGTSKAVRTYLDRELERIDMPGHHHGFIELPDGTLAWAQHLSGSTSESIVERPPGSGAARVVWSCADDPEIQNCRSNALEYDVDEDVYWFSSYTLNAMTEVDRSTGELLGYTDLRRPGPADATRYVFDPAESILTWQHGPRVLDDGNLLISTDDPQRSSTRVAEYEVDRDTGTFTEVWSYDPQTKSEFNGDVLRLPGGTTMHALGAAGIVYEVTRDGEEIWRMSFPIGHQVGRLAVVEDLYALVAP